MAESLLRKYNLRREEAVHWCVVDATLRIARVDPQRPYSAMH